MDFSSKGQGFDLSNILSRTRPSKRTVLLAPLVFLSYLYIFIVFRTIPTPGSQARLALPKEEEDIIPKKLWYKLGPHGLTEDARAWTDSCIRQNPDYEYEFMTDKLSEAWVAGHFAEEHPELVQTYQNLTVPIIKADILRYLLLYVEGGVYNDLDVTCNIPFDKWVPAEYRANTSLVVGWEFDVGWGENIVREFATWTIMSKPASVHMWALIQEIIQLINDKKREQNLESVAQLTPATVGDVVDTTGPRMFTKSILKSLGQHVLGVPVDKDSIKNIMHPKLVGDVLILPGYSFAAESNHYRTEEQLGPPLVTHHGAGSWKNEHGGEVI
jgi:alpha 1,6-mannosyltransferase